MADDVDVLIVGSRCAGSAAAIALARRNRSVLALDGAGFPSDTLSTHLLFPNHWAELERLGACDRVMDLGAPMHTMAGLGVPGIDVVGPYAEYDGWTTGACVRRPGLDMALVETARAAGAEIREHCRVTDLLRDVEGRVTGVRYKRRDGTTGTVRAKLVIGADGRRSTVAKLVDAREHHRWENQRMMAFAYVEDSHADQRHVAMQWRVSDDLVTVFPCDGGQSVALLMPPRRRSEEFRADPQAAFDATVRRVPQLAARIDGCEQIGRIRVSSSHPSYFRHSHGPGWALAGDAGHFKDPVTAQGIRDALRFGRLLGEAAAPTLDDPVALDAALGQYERDRDAQCLSMYQWANGLGRDDAVSPIEYAAYRWFADRPDGLTELTEVFTRKRRAPQVFTPARTLRWIAMAGRDPAFDGADVRRTVRRDVGRELGRLVEQVMFTRRRDTSARQGGPSPQDSERSSNSDEPSTRSTLTSITTRRGLTRGVR